MNATDNLASLEQVQRHYGFASEAVFRIAWSALTPEEQTQIRREVFEAIRRG